MFLKKSPLPGMFPSQIRVICLCFPSSPCPAYLPIIFLFPFPRPALTAVWDDTPLKYVRMRQFPVDSDDTYTGTQIQARFKFPLLSSQYRISLSRTQTSSINLS